MTKPMANDQVSPRYERLDRAKAYCEKHRLRADSQTVALMAAFADSEAACSQTVAPWDAEEIAAEIVNYCSKWFSSPLEHIKNIAEIIKAAPPAVSTPRCPKCGGHHFEVYGTMAKCGFVTCKHNGPAAQFFQPDSQPSPRSCVVRGCTNAAVIGQFACSYHLEGENKWNT